MAHTNELIYQINLGGYTYEVHDAHAVHTLADLAALGIDVEGAFIFKGTVATFNDLPKTDNKIGYVYHVADTHTEYVWAKVDDSTVGTWEEFGEHFVVNHVHEVVVTGHNADSNVTGTAVVTGGNSSSSVSGTASVTVPTVSETAVYAKVNTNNDTFVKSYSGEARKMVTTNVTGAGAAVSVVNSVTPVTGSVTGVSGSTTASKVSAKTVVANAVVENGVLTISFGNSVDTEDVTVPVAAANATTVVTDVTSGNTNVATVGSAVTVATGAIASNGAGDEVLVGLGTATTGNALTSAALAAGTTSDFYTGDNVTVGSATATGSVEGTAAAQVWTQNIGEVTGTATAQVWTQDSGITGAPIAE